MRDFGYDWDRRHRAWHRCSSKGERLTAETNAKIDRERTDRTRRMSERMVKRRSAGLSL